MRWHLDIEHYLDPFHVLTPITVEPIHLVLNLTSAENPNPKFRLLRQLVHDYLHSIGSSSRNLVQSLQEGSGLQLTSFQDNRAL